VGLWLERQDPKLCTSGRPVRCGGGGKMSGRQAEFGCLLLRRKSEQERETWELPTYRWH
jgi:hypothetical protein